ncbi:hypothetical protein [Hoeflea alexandrii]|uniref:Uncharacterized protein n=1 Tax=Hoeflea alexandrii TaxID=288436 RepID=A0ABT1CRN9_9HYPH|nr:hypothetical protein [Hoeflea alexandrii]MCO6408036.1 hypothetical protein [Hoeflea alexandrii]MCY0153623.1 hypothetical protein [Hoeflea alexandrii]
MKDDFAAEAFFKDLVSKRARAEFADKTRIEAANTAAEKIVEQIEIEKINAGVNNSGGESRNTLKKDRPSNRRKVVKKAARDIATGLIDAIAKEGNHLNTVRRRIDDWCRRRINRIKL